MFFCFVLSFFFFFNNNSGLKNSTYWKSHFNISGSCCFTLIVASSSRSVSFLRNIVTSCSLVKIRLNLFYVFYWKMDEPSLRCCSSVDLSGTNRQGHRSRQSYSTVNQCKYSLRDSLFLWATQLCKSTFPVSRMLVFSLTGKPSSCHLQLTKCLLF